eukprot:scaffold60268_cov27-Tisochrysis_lutea.AAC.9
MPAAAHPIVPCGARSRLTPAINSAVLSRARSEWEAVCAATSEAEHPVSSARDGPFIPKTYEMRPAATAREAAVVA